MNIRKSITFLIMALICAASANATIIGFNCAADGDGAIAMDPAALSEKDGVFTLAMSGKQYWAPAHVAGDFFTDTEEDPTVYIIESVDNYTNFSWTGYDIAIGMNKTFQIVSAIAPAGWTYTIAGPTANLPLPGHPSPGTGYVGHVTFSGGQAIAPGQSGTFGVVVAFLGQVAFSTEQVPTPEPATMALLGLGLPLLLRKK